MSALPALVVVVLASPAAGRAAADADQGHHHCAMAP
jgi:hypothetical protein